MVALVGCATVEPEPLNMDATLLSGSAIFGGPVSVDEAPVYPILTPSPRMHAFVGDIGEARLSVVRFSRLLDKLKDSGFFHNRYDAGVTLTASETFDAKVGNCISYTNLFVALARLANLNVYYQVVEIEHPTWNVDAGMLIRNNHINLVIDGPRFDRNRTSGHTIDFNVVDADPDARTRRVSDAYAASLFYANLSVDALLEGQDRKAFALLRRALQTEPRNADLWINLGAMYGRHGAHEQALRSYRMAEVLNPREKIVYSGLERSYRALGAIEEADRLARKIRRYRQMNPYYHFAVAQTAYDREDFVASGVAIERALRLKRRNPRFHYLRSLVQRQLGDPEGAARSLKKAERYGRFDDLEKRYAHTPGTASR